MKFTRTYRKNTEKINKKLKESQTISIKQLSRLFNMHPFEVYLAMPHCFHKYPKYIGLNGNEYNYLFELKKETKLVKIIYKTNIRELEN